MSDRERPAIRVVRGSPRPAELVALTTVLLALSRNHRGDGPPAPERAAAPWAAAPPPSWPPLL